MQAHRYTLPHRLIHWAVAVFVLCTLFAGLTISWMGYYDGLVEAFGNAVTNAIFKYHKTFGVLILTLMLIRVGLRLRYGKPPYIGQIPAMNLVVSRIVHMLLYLALLVMPVLGWLATAAGDYPVQFFEWNLPGLIGTDKELSETLFMLHGVIGRVLLVLVILHVSGALYHWLIRRDEVMRRMSLFK